MLKKTVDSCKDDLEILRKDFDLIQSKLNSLVQKRENEINGLVIVETMNKHLTKREAELEMTIVNMEKEIKCLKDAERQKQNKKNLLAIRYTKLKEKLEKERFANKRNKEIALRNSAQKQARLEDEIKELKINLESEKSENFLLKSEQINGKSNQSNENSNCER
jgi:hypothetical protein